MFKSTHLRASALFCVYLATVAAIWADCATSGKFFVHTGTLLGFAAILPIVFVFFTVTGSLCYNQRKKRHLLRLIDTLTPEQLNASQIVEDPNVTFGVAFERTCADSVMLVHGTSLFVIAMVFCFVYFNAPLLLLGPILMFVVYVLVMKREVREVILYNSPYGIFQAAQLANKHK